MDVWHYNVDTLEIRDENGLLVASDANEKDGALIALAPELVAAIREIDGAWDDGDLAGAVRNAIELAELADPREEEDHDS